MTTYFKSHIATRFPLVGDDEILLLSSAEERYKFAEITFVCDLCAGVLISKTRGVAAAVWTKPEGETT